MNKMEEINNILNQIETNKKTLENKKIDASAKKAAQEEYLKEQENILNTFDFDSLKEEEKYKKKAELYGNIATESEKLECYRKDLSEKEQDFKKIEKEVSGIKKAYDKYNVEYEKLINSKKQYELALDNQNLTPVMKVERETKLAIIEFELEKIELLLDIKIKEHINYLPEYLKEKITEELNENQIDDKQEEIELPEMQSEKEKSVDVVNIKGPELIPEKQETLKTLMNERDIDKVLISPKTITAVVGDEQITENKEDKYLKINTNNIQGEPKVVSEPNLPIPRQKVSKIVVINDNLKAKEEAKKTSVLEKLKEAIGKFFKGNDMTDTIVQPSSNQKLTGQSIKEQMTAEASFENIPKNDIPQEQLMPETTGDQIKEDMLGSKVAPVETGTNEAVVNKTPEVVEIPNNKLTGYDIKNQMLGGAQETNIEQAKQEFNNLVSGIPERNQEEYNRQIQEAEQNVNSIMIDNQQKIK